MRMLIHDSSRKSYHGAFTSILPDRAISGYGAFRFGIIEVLWQSAPYAC